MNYIILATERSLEECLESFKGHVFIYNIGEDHEYVDFIREASLKYIDNEGKPIPKVILLNDLKPSLKSVFYKGNGYMEIQDPNTGEIVNEPFELDKFINMNSYHIVKDPIKVKSLYMLANQVYNGNRPLIFTCKESDDEDLALTQIVHNLFLNWFKILPVSIYELIQDPSIMDSLPEPKYKLEVDNFIREYKKRTSESVNLR